MSMGAGEDANAGADAGTGERRGCERGCGCGCSVTLMAGGVKTGMEVKTSTAQMLAWGWRLARSGRWRERRGEGRDAGKKRARRRGELRPGNKEGMTRCAVHRFC